MFDLTPDQLGWIGSFFIFSGTGMLYFKWKTGWLLRAIGDFFWVIAGYQLSMSSIVITEGIFILSDFGGYFWWRRSENAERKGQG